MEGSRYSPSLVGWLAFLCGAIQPPINRRSLRLNVKAESLASAQPWGRGSRRELEAARPEFRRWPRAESHGPFAWQVPAR
jgi:hypothetical protein